MRRDTHPAYRPVVFRDVAVPEGTPGRELLTRSTAAAQAQATVTWTDGRVCPVIEVQISSVNHPCHTGRATVIGTAGRVEKSYRRHERTEPQGDVSR